MAGEPDSEQPVAGRYCPACGALAQELARYCASCGQTLAAAVPEVDVGGWIQAGWRVFISNLSLAIAIPLVVVIPMMGLFVLGYFGVIVMAVLSDPEAGTPPILPIVAGAGLGLVAFILALAMPALQAGVCACFLQGVRTGKVTADSLWDGFHHWWACTWVSWALGIAMTVCLPFTFILVGIPGLVALQSLGWLSLFRIVDTGEGGMDALSFAWQVLRGRLWMVLLSTFLIGVLMSAGAMGMYIGVVVTVPIGTAALAAGYDSLRKKHDPQP